MRPFEDEVRETMICFYDTVRRRGTDAALRDAVEALVRVKREYRWVFSNLLDLAEAIWAQWSRVADDGSRHADGIAALERAQKILQDHGMIDAQGRLVSEARQRAQERVVFAVPQGVG